jgi:hypothetical protein
LIPLSREPAVLAYHLRELVVLANLWDGLGASSQPKEAEKTIGGRDSPVVRNLLLLFIEVTSLGASSSGIPPQGASCSSKPVNWKPLVLAYHHRELVVPANLWMKVTYNL